MQNPYMDALSQGSRASNQTFQIANQSMGNAINAFNSAGSLSMKIITLLDQEEAQKASELQNQQQLLNQAYNNIATQQLKKQQNAISQQRVDESVRHDKIAEQNQAKQIKQTGIYQQRQLKLSKDRINLMRKQNDYANQINKAKLELNGIQSYISMLSDYMTKNPLDPNNAIRNKEIEQLRSKQEAIYKKLGLSINTKTTGFNQPPNLNSVSKAIGSNDSTSSGTFYPNNQNQEAGNSNNIESGIDPLANGAVKANWVKIGNNKIYTIYNQNGMSKLNPQFKTILDKANEPKAIIGLGHLLGSSLTKNLKGMTTDKLPEFLSNIVNTINNKYSGRKKELLAKSAVFALINQYSKQDSNTMQTSNMEDKYNEAKKLVNIVNNTISKKSKNISLTQLEKNDMSEQIQKNFGFFPKLYDNLKAKLNDNTFNTNAYQILNNQDYLSVLAEGLTNLFGGHYNVGNYDLTSINNDKGFHDSAINAFMVIAKETNSKIASDLVNLIANHHIEKTSPIDEILYNNGIIKTNPQAIQDLQHTLYGDKQRNKSPNLQLGLKGYDKTFQIKEELNHAVSDITNSINNYKPEQYHDGIDLNAKYAVKINNKEYKLSGQDILSVLARNVWKPIVFEDLQNKSKIQPASSLSKWF